MDSNPRQPSSSMSYEKWLAMFQELGLGSAEARYAAAGAVGELDPEAIASQDDDISV